MAGYRPQSPGTHRELAPPVSKRGRDVGRHRKPERESSAQAVNSAQLPQKTQGVDTSRLVYDDHVGPALSRLVIPNGETRLRPLELRSEGSAGQRQPHAGQESGGRVLTAQAGKKINATWIFRHGCVDRDHVGVSQ